jgi:hypothetical protein
MPWQDQDVLDALKETYDLESEYKLQRDQIHTKKFKDKLDMERIKHIDHSLQDVIGIRQSVVDNNPGVYEAYVQKYKTVQKPEPEEEGTSPLAGLLRGTKDTLGFVAKHPQRAGAHANLGVESFASLPFRGLETALMGEKGEYPFASAKKWLRGREENVRKGDIEAGVTPGSTGPAVAEAVGGMAVPVGPALKAGQLLKNILKGGAFAGSISAGEEFAQKGDVTAEQTGTATGFGMGLTGALSALLGRGKAPRMSADAGPVPSTHPEAGPKPSPAGPAEGAPLQLEHKPIIYGQEPPRGLPAPTPPEPKGPAPYYDRMMEAVKSKAASELTPDEQGFVLSQRGTVNPPPNAAGARDVVGDIPTRERKLSEVMGLKPTPKQGAEAATPTRPPITERPPDDMVAAKPEVTSAPTQPTRTLTDVVRPKPPVRPIETLEPPGAPSQRELYGTPEPTMAKAAPEPEVSPITAKATAQTKEMSGKSKLLTPEEAINIAKEMDAHKVAMEKEATLRDVVSGKLDVSKVPMKRSGKARGVKGGTSKEVPKSEAPAPTVKGEVGAPIEEVGVAVEPKIDFFGGTPVRPLASGQMSKSKAEPLAEIGGDQNLQRDLAAVDRMLDKAGKMSKEVPLEKPTKTTKVELQPKRTEDFIKEQGYKVREREPFPGEKEYDIIDPRTGNIIARGDREQLTHALGNVKEAKGFKLHSFPSGIEDFVPLFKDKLRCVGARVPEGVDVDAPKQAGTLNTLLRPFETPEFNVRKSEAGRTITDAGREADRQINRRVRDLITEEVVPGKEYTPTKLSAYFSADAEIRDKVNKVLVLGDKAEEVYTPAQLTKYGLTTDEVTMYQGVREALDKVVNWVKELGPDYAEFDSRKIDGYIPRVWKGDWEIFVNGNKHLRAKTETSSFSTLSEAAAEAHGIKAGDPKAKIAIKFFPDPEYLSSRGLQDARVIARLKSNLERMGHMDSAAIDEAFKMGKSVKGFAKHLLERKDASGYETQDLDKVLNSYFYQAARRVEMQKVKSVAESVLKESKADLSPGQVRYMQEYVERVAGKPAWDQIAIHQFVQDTPIGKWIDPVRGGKLISSGKEFITHLTLGFGNVGWAAINLDGLTRHVWPMLANEAKMVGSKDLLAAEKYGLNAVKEFFKNKGLRQQLAHHGVIDIQLMSEPTPKIGHEFGKGHWTPERVSLLLGTATEEFSRGVAAIARYNMALDHGATPAVAMQDAARFVEQTLGRYTRGGRPPIYTGAIGSTVGLFKTYMTVMLQNGWKALESKDVGTITRYIAGAVGVSGVLGLVPGIEDMDDAITKNFGWSPIEMIEKNLPPAVATGLLTISGVDLSRKAGVPEIFPDNARGWAGPVVGRYASVIADIMNGEYGEAALDMLPNSIRNILAVTRGMKEGKIIGRLDKPSFEATPKEATLHAIGVTPAREAAESRLYGRNVNKEIYRDEKLNHLTRKIVAGKASDEDYAEFSRLGGKHQRIKNERRRQQETLIERQFRHLPKRLRMEQPRD